MAASVATTIAHPRTPPFTRSSSTDTHPRFPDPIRCRDLQKGQVRDEQRHTRWEGTGYKRKTTSTISE